MEEESRRLRSEARRLARGKHPSQVRYPDRFRRATLSSVSGKADRGGTGDIHILSVYA